MADLKENEMNGGVPAKLRGIDATGKSVSSTMQEVADALPEIRNYGEFVYYSLPRFITTIRKTTAGNETKTLTLFKKGDNFTSHLYYFEIFTAPANSSYHSLPGWCKVHYAPAGTLQEYISHVEYGFISNLRQVIYEGNIYYAVDILVNQYGASKIGLTGFHEDISQIMDVTGQFSEV